VLKRINVNKNLQYTYCDKEIEWNTHNNTSYFLNATLATDYYAITF